jgi:hypothetical protein
LGKSSINVPVPVYVVLDFDVGKSITGTRAIGKGMALKSKTFLDPEMA